MKKRLNITEGKAELRTNTPYDTGGWVVFTGRGENNRTIVRFPHGHVVPCPKDERYYENKGNAELFADALNTANETQKLPSELKKERDKCLSLLEEIATNNDIGFWWKYIKELKDEIKPR